MISTMLVEDHLLVRKGIRTLLEQAGDIIVVAEAESGIQAIQILKSTNPDIILMDISMPDMDGLEACKIIMETHPNARILILTMHPGEIYAVRVLKAGALGYITKMASADELFRAIRMVASGQSYLSEKTAGLVVSQLLQLKGKHCLLDVLSDREVQVLDLIALGKKSKEIAVNLNISPNTVQNYRTRILRKLGLHNNAELINFYHVNSI